MVVSLIPSRCHADTRHVLTLSVVVLSADLVDDCQLRLSITQRLWDSFCDLTNNNGCGHGEASWNFDGGLLIFNEWV